MASTESPAPTHVVGIDLGSDTAVVSLMDLKTLRADILRNDLSNQQTPNVVCLHDKERSFGELAKQKLTSSNHIRNSVNGCAVFHALANGKDGDAQQGSAIGRLATSGDQAAFQVDYDAEELNLAPHQVLAMYLGKLNSFVAKSLSTMDAEDKPSSYTPTALVLPETLDAAQRTQVERACRIAGLDLALVVTRGAASAMTYGTKKSTETLAENRRVMIVDVGFAYGTVSVYEWGVSTAADDGAETDDQGEKEANPKLGKCLATATTPSLGSSVIDNVLFDECAAECGKKFGQPVKRGTKAGMRLMNQVAKLKKTLSAVPEGDVICENVGPDGQDLRFSFKRADLENLCSKYVETFQDTITKVLSESLEASPCEDKSAFLGGGVELIGGGTYVPWVQTCIKKSVDGVLGSDVHLCFTLDSLASGSTGASYHVAKLFEPTGAVVRPVFDTLARFVDGDDIVFKVDLAAAASEPSETDLALEKRMCDNDETMKKLHDEMNKLESFIFEHKSIANGYRGHGDLINKDTCLAILDAAENWMYDEGDVTLPDATWEKYSNKLAELESQLAEPLAEYNAKVEQERKETEERLAREAEEAAKEAEANGDKDDHDFRKLKKPERMKKLMMNKDEGTSLFKDGNYQAATLRYIRALQHSTKFFDLGPEDEKEVQKLALSCHLNMAQCYIKLDKMDDVIKSCNNALEIDDAHPKALYRRAFAFEKTSVFDKAKVDIEKAKAVAPEGDKAVKKLGDRIDAQLARQKAKQKKMAQKMFG